MMRLLRQYGVSAALGLALLVAVAGGSRAGALTLPSQTFSSLQNVGGVALQLRETPREAQEVTAGVVARQLSARGVEGDVDVAAIVERGDYSSVYALEGLAPSEKQALVSNIHALQQENTQLLDRAKLLSAQAATIQQPADGEGGGFGAAVAAGLANSSQDLLSDVTQYQDQLAETREQLEDLEKLWKGLQVVLAAKPAFLPEKPDNDTFVVCVNHVGPAQLYPQLYAGISDAFVAQLNSRYASVLEQVTTTVQREANISGRLMDLTANPLRAAEVAFAQAGDYGELLRAGESVVRGQGQSSADQLSSRYGRDFAPVAELRGVPASDMGGAHEELARIVDALPDAIAERQSNIMSGLRAAAADPAAAGDAPFDAARAAAGPEGAAIVDAYASLVKTGSRSGDPAAVQARLGVLEGQLEETFARSAASQIASVRAARDVAGSFAGSSPSQLLASAGAARDRVDFRAAANLLNETAIVTRLSGRELFSQTIGAELDTWTQQVGDFQYLTNLAKILQYKAYLKPPTT